MKPTAIIAIGAVLSASFAATPAKADYQLAPGDSVDVSVFGRVELSRRALVDLDGRIALPLLGGVAVAGLSVEDAQAAIAERLRAGDLVRDAHVLVSVGEFRPIYINGDVAFPKSYPFLPGLTVRQAIAAAGGLGHSTGGAASPLARLDQLAEYRQVQVEVAALSMRLERMRAELDGKTAPPRIADVGDGAVKAIARLETLQFENRKGARAASLESLQVLSSLTNDQLVALEKQRQQSQESVTQQAEEVDKARGMLGRGLTTSNRLTDEQRALALLKTQLLGNIAQSAETRRLRAELDRKVGEIAERQRAELLSGLAEGTVTLEKLRARGDLLAQKIADRGAVAAEQTDGGVTMDVVVHRTDGKRRDSFAADEDAPLRPGDVVDVKVRMFAGTKPLAFSE